MSRRHLSQAEQEIGIHERPSIDELNAVCQRQKRPPLKPEFDPELRPAPKSWHLTTFTKCGYLLCKQCKAPTEYAPESQVCVRCGSDRVEWVPPIF